MKDTFRKRLVDLADASFGTTVDIGSIKLIGGLFSYLSYEHCKLTYDR